VGRVHRHTFGFFAQWLSRNATCNLQHSNDLKIHCRGLFTVLAQVKASLLKKQQAPAGAHESSPAGTAG